MTMVKIPVPINAALQPPNQAIKATIMGPPMAVPNGDPLSSKVAPRPLSLEVSHRECSFVPDGSRMDKLALLSRQVELVRESALYWY